MARSTSRRQLRSKETRPDARHLTPSTLRVRVTPRAARNEVAGWRGETLLVRLTAPPVEGAANAACREFLAELLGVRRADIQLAAGEKARDKRFEVSGLTFDEIQEKIRERTGA